MEGNPLLRGTPYGVKPFLKGNHLLKEILHRGGPLMEKNPLLRGTLHVEPHRERSLS